VELQFSGELYYSAHSLGQHEVVVPKEHNKDLQDMEANEIDELFQVYQNRLLTHKNNPYIGYSLVIHNHGLGAGASVAHPHSQIFASEIIPTNIISEIEGSKNWHIKNSNCVYCEIVKQELELKQRTIEENEDFLAIAAYAPKFSGEIWILPKHHISHFELIRHDSRKNLANIFSTIIKKMDIGFGDPDYNFFIHTSPFKTYNTDKYYHFHIEITPRVSIWGGFELGAGMPIDVLLPEKVAEFMKEIKI
jgi:UDPglucose--hexose-1-phosphate uridylyltransferase